MYVPHLHRTPWMPAWMSVTLGFGLLFKSAHAAMSLPGWQNPHWLASAGTQAAWRAARTLSVVPPSAVRI